MPTERFDINLFLLAKAQEANAFSETEVGLKLVQDAVKRFSEAEANGAAVTEAYKVSIGGLRVKALEAGASFAEEADLITDARKALERFRAAEAMGIPFDEALTLATVENTVAMDSEAMATDANTESQQAQIASVQEVIGSVLALGGAIWGTIPAYVLWGVAIAVVVGELAPLLAALGSGLVVVTAWAVAMSGAALAIAGIGATAIALSGGMILLADHFSLIEKPVARFVDSFKHASEQLGVLSEGPATRVLAFLTSLIPGVEKAGASLIRWFGGARLSGFIKELSDIGHAVGPTALTMFKNIGIAWDVMNKPMGKGQQSPFEAIASSITTTLLGAIGGLITNLTNLAVWWEKHKELQKDVAQVFDWLGRAIQWVGNVWASLTDWITANWPATMKTAQDWIDKIKEQLDKWGPVFITIAGLIWQFAQIGLQALEDHGAVLVPLLLITLTTLLALAAAFLLVAGAVIIIADAIFNFIANTDNAFVDWANSIISSINKVIDGLNKIPGVSIQPVPYIGRGGTTKGPNVGIDTNKQGKGGSYGNQAIRHTGGNVMAGDAYVVGKPGAEEIFIPQSSGRVIPAEMGSMKGSDSSGFNPKVVELLSDIEDHLNAMRTAAPGVNASAAVRRG